MPKNKEEKKKITKKASITKASDADLAKSKTKTKAKAKAKARVKAKEKKEEKKYFEAIGRRKTSTARVRLYTIGKKGIIVNDKPYGEYFRTLYLRKIVKSPLEKLNLDGKYRISILVKGGGVYSQAGSCRHGIARALVKVNTYFRKKLKKAGHLTRDPRMRERKKPGLKRARRAPQWRKR